MRQYAAHDLGHPGRVGMDAVRLLSAGSMATPSRKKG